MAQTPEASEYTSAHDHIEHRQAQLHIQALKKKQKKKLRQLSQGEAEALKEEQVHLAADAWLCPFATRQKAGKGPTHDLLSLQLDEYLDLLDWTGRRLVAGKRGATPEGLKPILQRLRIDSDRWCDTVSDFGRLFHLVAGHVDVMLDAAHRAGRHWFQGLDAGDTAFPGDLAPG
ncbi:MAG: hypothetical protein ACYTGH_13560 [Planctomycetota bacterium]